MEQQSTLSDIDDAEVLRRHGIVVRHVGTNYEPTLALEDASTSVGFDVIKDLLALANEGRHPITDQMWDTIYNTLQAYRELKHTLIRG